MKIGIVGLGVMGRNHLRVLEQLSGGRDQILVFDPQVCSATYEGRASALDSMESFLDIDFDYVVASSPTKTHLDIARALLEARTPVLMEKPLSNDLPSSRQIFELAEKSEMPIAVGYLERFNPAIRQLRKFMAESDLGKLLHVSSTRLGPYTGRIRDVGVTLDLASHDLDLAIWLSQGEFTSISGNLKSKYNKEFEDICLIRGSLSGGAVYSGEISWVYPFKVRKTRLLFEGGLLEADTLTGDATLYHIVDWEESTSSPSVFIEPKSSSMVRGSIDKVEPLLLEHLEFRRFLEDGNPGELCTVDDAFKVMLAAEVVLEKQS